MSALNLKAGESDHLDASLQGIVLFLQFFLPSAKIALSDRIFCKGGQATQGKTILQHRRFSICPLCLDFKFLFFPYCLFFRTASPLSLSYHTALMLTFSPGVKSSVTNSQLQLLFSSGMSSPGRLASGFGRGRNKDNALLFPMLVPREKRQVGSQTEIPGEAPEISLLGIPMGAFPKMCYGDIQQCQLQLSSISRCLTLPPFRIPTYINIYIIVGISRGFLTSYYTPS